MARTHIINGCSVKTRHPLAPLGLSILTLGIYGVYWYYAVNRELRDLGEDVKPGLSVLAVTLGALVIVPLFVSQYNTAERIRRVQERAGIASPISPVVALVMLVIPFFNMLQAAYLQSGLNRAYEQLLPATAASSSPSVSATAPPASPVA